jgi:hypothetical protein
MDIELDVSIWISSFFETTNDCHVPSDIDISRFFCPRRRLPAWLHLFASVDPCTVQDGTSSTETVKSLLAAIVPLPLPFLVRHPPATSLSSSILDDLSIALVDRCTPPLH